MICNKVIINILINRETLFRLQLKTLSLSPDVENFRDINNRNERDKAFKGSFFLSLCVSLCLSDEASIYEAQQADDF